MVCDQWSSSLDLNWLTEQAETTSGGSAFQSFITLTLNEFLRTSQRQYGARPVTPQVRGDRRQLPRRAHTLLT